MEGDEPITDPAAVAPDTSAAPAASAAPATLLSGVKPAEGAPDPVAAALAAPAKAKYVNDDGAFSEDWRQHLDPSIKDYPYLAGLKNINDAAKAIVEKDKMIAKRQDRVGIPKADDPPEKWAEYRKQTGAPETPLAYGDLRPEAIPKEAWDTTLENTSREIAHKWGIPAAALKELAEAQSGRMMSVAGEQQAQHAAELQRGHDALRQEWGEDLPRQMAYASQAATAFGLSPDHAMFKDPEVIKAFSRAYEMGLAGDRKVNGSLPGAGGIDDRIAEVRASNAYKGTEGPEASQRAQKTLHALMDAKTKSMQKQHAA